MSIRAKLLWGFIGVSLIGALIGLVGILSLNNSKTAIDSMYQNGTKGLVVMIELNNAVNTIRIAIRDEALSQDPAENQRIGEVYRQAVAAANEQIKAYEATITDEVDRANYNELIRAYGPWLEVQGETLQLGLQNRNDEAAASMKDTSRAKIRSDLNAAIAKVTQYNVDDSARLNATNREAADLAMILMLVALVTGIAVSVVLGLLVTNSITKPVGRVNNELSEASKALESASFQVSSSSQELSSSSSELASSIEEMTSSLEELQSIIEANTKNVNQSELLMQETNRDAKKVAERVAELKDALVDISGQSKKISKIIKVIDDIAFQTNILALNAAVEAARAGDAGKGFAVVADQVKALAQKSADAAKETADLIEKAIEASDRGERLGGEVKEAQDANAEKSEKVAVLLDEVNRGSKEQLKGANQITVAVTQINSIVQNTASSSEENAAAGEELASQSEALAQNVVQLSRIITGKAPEQAEVRTTTARTKAAPKSVTPTPSGQKRIQGVEVTKPEDIIPLKDFKDF